MSSSTLKVADGKHEQSAVRRLGLPALLLVQLLIYGVIWQLSKSFEYGAPLPGRPIPLALGCFSFNFALHLISLVWALRSPDSRSLLAWCLWGLWHSVY